MVAARIRGMARSPLAGALTAASSSPGARSMSWRCQEDLRAAGGGLRGRSSCKPFAWSRRTPRDFFGLVAMWLLMSARDDGAHGRFPAFATYDEIGAPRRNAVRRADRRISCRLGRDSPFWPPAAQMMLTQGGCAHGFSGDSRSAALSGALLILRRALPVQRAEGSLPEQMPRAARLLHAALGDEGPVAQRAAPRGRCASAAAGP